jgi:AbrB family looped-hinge helix DNA binding protein
LRFKVSAQGEEGVRKSSYSSLTALETTVVSTKGQIVLPKSIRESQEGKPGTELTVEETKDGVLLRAASRLPRTKLDDVVGFLRWRGKPKTIAQMNAAIEKELKRRHARGRY